MSPGPSLLMVIRNTTLRGSMAGVLFSLSHALGVGVYATLVVFGLAYVITNNDLLFAGLRYGGALFLLYLAWSAWRSANASQALTQLATAPPLSPASAMVAARDGMLTGLLNPKIALWFLALFSQFVGSVTSLAQRVGIVLLAVAIDALWYLVVVAALSRWRMSNQADRLANRYARPINIGFALLLTLIALRVVWAP